MCKDDPQISMEPLEFMLASHSMTDVEYKLWGNGVSYAERLLEGLDYKEFNITRLMPSLTVQVYDKSLVLLPSLFLFVCHDF